MCIPTPPNPAPAAVAAPSMQSASAFNFGGDTPGANIGRLALRLTSGAASSGLATSAAARANPAAPPAQSQSAPAPAASAQATPTDASGLLNVQATPGRSGFTWTPNQLLGLSKA